MNRTAMGWRWWISHEFRLAMREMQLGLGPIAAFLCTGTLLGTYLMLHVVAYVLLPYLDAGIRGAPGRFEGLLLALLFAATGVRGIGISQRMLYGRHDVKLLLGSPVRIADVLRARALVLAAASVAVPLFLLSPVANVAVLLGHSGMLAFYPLALSLAVTVSLLAVAVAACSRRWLGRVGAQAVARAGMTLVLLLALASRLPGLKVPMALAALRIEGAATWLGMALAGQLAPLWASLAVSAVAGSLLPRLLATVYLSGMRESGSADRRPVTRRRRLPATTGRWTRLLATACQLTWRHPERLWQAGLSAVVMAVAVVAVGRHQSLAAGQLADAALVCALGAFGAEAGWLMTRGEQMPWLLACAPLPRGAWWMVRCLSAHVFALPVLFVVVVGLAIYRPSEMPIALAFGAGALSTSLLLATSMAPATAADGDRSTRRNGLLSACSMACYGGWAAAAAILHATVAGGVLLALGAAATGIVASLGFHHHAGAQGRRA
jgi:ABC-2 type transport system permease protein